MDYQVYTPCHELQPFVKCFWTLEAEASHAIVKQRIVPDGCMELIIHYGDHFRQYFEDGTSIIQPRSFIFGQISSPLEIAPLGVTGIVAARFHPEGLVPFLSIPVATLENKAVETSGIFGKKGRSLEEAVLSAQDNTERVKLIESFLLAALAEPPAIDTMAKTCVDTIFQCRGQLGIEGLAGKLKMNRRNMERKLASTVGISPKQLSKLARMQATLKMLAQNKDGKLTSLAYEGGYYDQAHFIKDFKEFTGISPKSFFGDNLRLTTLFISTE